MSKNIAEDTNLVAACGLYCGMCEKYVNKKCPGCKENVKASWCKIRSCCIENNYKSCADCKLSGYENCKKFNNLIGKIFGLIFNSDRNACILKIKESGYEQFAKVMVQTNRHTIKRK